MKVIYSHKHRAFVLTSTLIRREYVPDTSVPFTGKYTRAIYVFGMILHEYDYLFGLIEIAGHKTKAGGCFTPAIFITPEVPVRRLISALKSKRR